MNDTDDDIQARADSLVRLHGNNLYAAAHDCRVTLESIRPYRDRRTSALLGELEKRIRAAAAADEECP